MHIPWNLGSANCYANSVGLLRFWGFLPDFPDTYLENRNSQKSLSGGDGDEKSSHFQLQNSDVADTTPWQSFSSPVLHGAREISRRHAMERGHKRRRHHSVGNAEMYRYRDRLWSLGESGIGGILHSQRKAEQEPGKLIPLETGSSGRDNVAKLDQDFNTTAPVVLSSQVRDSKLGSTDSGLPEDHRVPDPVKSELSDRDQPSSRFRSSSHSHHHHRLSQSGSGDRLRRRRCHSDGGRLSGEEGDTVSTVIERNRVLETIRRHDQDVDRASKDIPPINWAALLTGRFVYGCP